MKGHSLFKAFWFLVVMRIAYMTLKHRIQVNLSKPDRPKNRYAEAEAIIQAIKNKSLQERLTTLYSQKDITHSKSKTWVAGNPCKSIHIEDVHFEDILSYRCSP